MPRAIQGGAGHGERRVVVQSYRATGDVILSGARNERSEGSGSDRVSTLPRAGGLLRGVWRLHSILRFEKPSPRSRGEGWVRGLFIVTGCPSAPEHERDDNPENKNG